MDFKSPKKITVHRYKYTDRKKTKVRKEVRVEMTLTGYSKIMKMKQEKKTERHLTDNGKK